MAELRIETSAGETYFEQKLMQDGKQVASLAVVDLMMRIGIAPVHTGGIAGVGTEQEHRNKGYARQVLEHTTQWMAENGFDCAMLFGIENFYHKFGYANCLSPSTFTIKARFAERAEKTLNVRPFTPEDIPAVSRIYAEANADLTGSIARGEKTRWLSKGCDYDTKAEAFVFTEAEGEVVAYAARDVANPESLWLEAVKVSEVGARSPRYFADIARWAAERAAELRVQDIQFLIPQDGLFGSYLMGFGAKQEIVHDRCGGGMGRLLRQTDFLRKTLPEWTRRAVGTDLPPGLSVRLETDLGTDTLHWTGEQIILDGDGAPASATVRLPQHRLMQLAMGHYSAELLPAFSDAQEEGDLTLFRALFPRRPAFMWLGDHF